MLDARWKKVAIALKVYALAAVLGLVAIAAIAGLVALGAEPSPGGATLAMIAVLAADAVALLAFVVSTGAILVYASVPAESGARGWAIVAAVAAVMQLPIAALSLVAWLAGVGPVLAVIADRLEPLLAFVTLYAMAKSLNQVASFIRADALYEKTSMVSTGLVLLLLLSIAATCLAFVARNAGQTAGDGLGLFAFLSALATAFFSVLLGVSYVWLVFRAGREVDAVIYE